MTSTSTGPTSPLQSPAADALDEAAQPGHVWIVRTLGSIVGGLLLAWPWLDERAFAAAWVGLAILIGATRSSPPHIAFRLWLLGGLAMLAASFHWLPLVASEQLDVGLAAAAMVSVLAVTWDAFRYGVFGYLVARLSSVGAATRGPWETLLWPTLWVMLEWFWPHLFPWRIGQTQLGWLVLAQLAEFTGVFGLSFLVMWGAAIGGQWLARLATRVRALPLRGIVAMTLVYAVLLVAAAGWGHWRMGQFALAGKASPAIRLTLVQPGARDDEMAATLERLSLAAASGSDLVIWGESTIGHYAAGAELADPHPCPGLASSLLCAGATYDAKTGPEGPIRNTALLIDADAWVRGSYHKRVLMPWGEYAVGQQWVPGLRDLLGSPYELIAGDSPAPLVLADGTRLGVLICYEDLMPGPARETVREGAEVLINLNNLVIFGRTAAISQHQHLARFRAIETRRWLVRCGTTGGTAVIDAAGRVVQQAPHHAPATLTAEIPRLTGRTIYTRCGDWFPAACVLALLAWLGQRLVSHLRRRARAKAPAEASAGA